MKKVLLVGGAGYVGSVMNRELLDRGYAIKVLDRLYFGKHGITPNHDRIQLIVGDMRTIDHEIFNDVEAIVNLGGLSNDPTAEYNTKANYEMNTLATYKLAEMAKACGIRRYIMASSCSIYDRGVSHQEWDIIQDETTPVEPHAAYSGSKYEAEKLLLKIADKNFCPIILRKGTLYGFSPRMRYDLVVNTFVMDALSKGVITIHYGGEMWRPLVDVRDAARTYIALLEADEKLVNGEIFNLVYANMRISELALRVQSALREVGVKVEINADYNYSGVRSYRVSGQKLTRVLGFWPVISIEESVKNMVQKIRSSGYTDFDNPKYHNIRWMKFLEEANEIISITGSVFESPQPIQLEVPAVKG